MLSIRFSGEEIAMTMGKYPMTTQQQDALSPGRYFSLEPDSVDSTYNAIKKTDNAIKKTDNAIKKKRTMQ